MIVGHFSYGDHDRLAGLSGIVKQLEEDAIGQQDQECVGLLVHMAKSLRRHHEALAIYDRAVLGKLPMEDGWEALKKVRHQHESPYPKSNPNVTPVDVLGLAKGYLLGNGWDADPVLEDTAATMTLYGAVQAALEFVDASEDVASTVWLLLGRAANTQDVVAWEQLDHRVERDVLDLLDQAIGHG